MGIGGPADLAPKWEIRRLKHMKLVFKTLLGAVLLTGSLTPSIAQSTPAIEQAPRKTSTPYSGDLTIFDYPDRDQKLHINQVMDLLGVTPGKTVADIGAGSGWFTVRAAKRVTASGKVYAVDINPVAITYIRQRAEKDGLENITTILGNAADPKLPATSVDAVMLLKTYHEVAKPMDLIRNLRFALRPGARVGIIDRSGNGSDHGVAMKVVISEMESAGYRLQSEHDDVVKGDRMDYFLIFTAK